MRVTGPRGGLGPRRDPGRARGGGGPGRPQLSAARDVADAQAMLDSPLDIAQQVGLFGTQVPSVDAAIPAVRAGDGDEVARITSDIRARSPGCGPGPAADGRRRIGDARAAGNMAVLLVRRARQASLRRAEARASAATVAVAEAHQRPVPFGVPGPELRATHPADDSMTKVWIVPIVPSEADADLGSLVRKPPGPPPDPPPVARPLRARRRRRPCDGPVAPLSGGTLRA